MWPGPFSTQFCPTRRELLLDDQDGSSLSLTINEAVQAPLLQLKSKPVDSAQDAALFIALGHKITLFGFTARLTPCPTRSQLRADNRSETEHNTKYCTGGCGVTLTTTPWQWERHERALLALPGNSAGTLGSFALAHDPQ